MSFWKSLFGGGGAPAPDRPAASEDYKGYVIEARPYPESGQYQVAGVIRKEVDGVPKEERFVRADRFATVEDAASVALVKARQIIDQNGDRLFRS